MGLCGVFVVSPAQSSLGRLRLVAAVGADVDDATSFGRVF